MQLEVEPPRMEHETSHASHGPILAVERISQDGMAKTVQVDPDLVAPAGLRRGLEQGSLLGATQNSVARQ